MTDDLTTQPQDLQDNQQDDSSTGSNEGSLEVSPEIVKSPETVEREQTYETPPEAPVAEVVKQPDDAVLAPQTQQVPEDLNVVDMRTSHEKTDNVDPDAQKLTKEADEEEEDFIEHVEQTHS